MSPSSDIPPKGRPQGPAPSAEVGALTLEEVEQVLAAQALVQEAVVRLVVQMTHGGNKHY